MGSSSSRPPPPPKVARKLGATSIQLQHMPPVISKTGEQGISAAAARRTYYLSEDEANSSPGAIGSTEGHLRNLIAVALGRCNIRDYVTLLIELSMLRLALDTGPPTLDALELAQAVNPFLNRQPGDVSISGGPSQPGESSTSRSDGPLPRPFRDTDTAMVTDTEKHLLVLLYYCDLSNLRKSPDEAVAQLSKVVWKYGNLPSIDLRKESFTETEIYIHWCIFYLTTNISNSFSDATLLPATRSQLKAEHAVELSRLLTICEMLSEEGRLDQICFLLMFLRRCAAAATNRGWWRWRARNVAKSLKQNRPGAQKWHKEYADKTLRGLKRLEDEGTESWQRRDSLQLSREHLEYGDLAQLKGE